MFLERYHSHESFLCHFQDRVQVFEVFEALWPAEFNALGVTPVSPLSDRVRAYRELFDLLHQKIPLWECDWEVYENEEEIEDGFLEHIPLEPQGNDYDECDPDYASLAERVILTICSKYEDDVVKALTRSRIKFGGIEKDSLYEICLRLPAAPSGLYDVFGLAFSSTGNQWLDIGPELYDASEKEEWSLRAVNHLIAEWQEAQVILKRIEEFNTWLEQDLRRIHQVEKWLQEATKPRQRVRIGHTAPRPLVETLTGSLLTDFDEGFDYDD